MRRSFVVAVTLWIALCTVSTAQEPPTKASVASDKANALFDEYWKWTLREYPDFATLFGDLRRFHNAVIDGGTIPLTVLEAQVGAWIESEKAVGTK